MRVRRGWRRGGPARAGVDQWRRSASATVAACGASSAPCGVAAVEALRDELGDRAVALECDVRDPEALSELAGRVYRDIGSVRLLVNNAGVEQFGYLWDTPVANWQRVLDINVSGVFHGVRAFLPRMMAAGEQAWVWNLSSIGGVAVVPLQAPYIVSKHAVLALTECLHLEMQQSGHDNHIHVQAVLPGAVVSNIFESAGGVDATLSGRHIGRGANPGHSPIFNHHRRVAQLAEQASAERRVVGDQSPDVGDCYAAHK